MIWMHRVAETGGQLSPAACAMTSMQPVAAHSTRATEDHPAELAAFFAAAEHASMRGSRQFRGNRQQFPHRRTARAVPLCRSGPDRPWRPHWRIWPTRASTRPRSNQNRLVGQRQHGRCHAPPGRHQHIVRGVTSLVLRCTLPGHLSCWQWCPVHDRYVTRARPLLDSMMHKSCHPM